MTVFRTIKCILRIVAKSPRHKGKNIILNQEAFRTLINRHKVSSVFKKITKWKLMGYSTLHQDLPIVSHLDPVSRLFILHSHQVHLWDSYSLHLTRRAMLKGVLLESC